VDATERSPRATIEVRDPQDNSLVGEVPQATYEDVADSVRNAVRGADIARRLPTHERIAILRRTAEAVEARRDEYALMIAREGVKTIREARRETSRAIETLRLCAEEARRITGESHAFDQRPGSERRVGYWTREPVGVVAAITPFNDPLNLVVHKVGPAIAAGNAVVLKPHSATPLTALLLAEAFGSSGLPDDVLQVITGRGSEIGAAIVGHRDVAMVTFTGGRVAGASIVSAAGAKKLVLEMGANSPVIVLADADLDAVAPAIIDGAFSVAGQNCLHVQRVLVHRDISERLEARLVDLAREIRVGDKQDEETDMGPLINESNAVRVQGFVNDAVARGGRLSVGGERRGAFVDPTIVSDLSRDSLLAREEVFGPVTGLIDIGSLDEAVEIANAIDYGLQASIFTRDIGAAMQAVRDLRAGAVIVNETSDYRTDAMPFGGVKGSGFGREGVPFAIQEMTATKVVCFNL